MSNTDLVYTFNALIGKQTFSKIIGQHITTEVYLNFVSKIERKSLESKKNFSKSNASFKYFLLLVVLISLDRETNDHLFLVH